MTLVPRRVSRLLKKSFYRALVVAKGYRLGGASAGSGVKGRQAEFRTRVHGNGNLLIGHAYTRRMGLEPGQEFHIQIHHETGSIWLVPVEDSTSAAADPNPAGGADGRGSAEKD
jgi:bifunctional DNA-binding transcriptional regulator/antitoxin component of YhaV-PrlF toxin-antitoxin module